MRCASTADTSRLPGWKAQYPSDNARSVSEGFYLTGLLEKSNLPTGFCKMEIVMKDLFVLLGLLCMFIGGGADSMNTASVAIAAAGILIFCIGTKWRQIRHVISFR